MVYILVSIPLATWLEDFAASGGIEEHVESPFRTEIFEAHSDILIRREREPVANRPLERPAVRSSEVEALPRKMNARCQPRSLKEPARSDLASGLAERDSREFQPLAGLGWTPLLINDRDV